MGVKTLVLSQRYTPDSNLLWKAALDVGWKIERLQTRQPPDWLHERDITLYGEALFVRIIADALGLALFETPFDWLPSQSIDDLRREICLTTLGDARQITKPTFIKPAGDKTFDAKVYQSGNDMPSSDILPDDLPVLISEPVHWEMEFRCFIRDGQIATYSPYLRDGELCKDTDGNWYASDEDREPALNFANDFLARTDLPPAIVLDIGRIRERGWAVIEANPAWGSGIYGCDPSQVLHVLGASLVKSADLPAQQRRWVIE